MARDHRRLHVFQIADSLVLDVYQVTAALPVAERYGLQAQLRRAAVSVAANIVEGSARRTTGEYLNFLNQTNGSAAEVAYLLTVADRLKILEDADVLPLTDKYAKLQRGLQAIINVLGDARPTSATTRHG
jgi:four helix bundle protein